MEINHEILSDIVVWSKYAKYDQSIQRREIWNEIADRNMQMHIRKFPHLEKQIRQAYTFVYDKKILPSMRSLQFAGKPIEVNNARLFNCSYLHIDDYRALASSDKGFEQLVQEGKALATDTKEAYTERLNSFGNFIFEGALP